MPGLLSRLLHRPRTATATWIEISELQRRLSEGGSVLLIDVRGPDEFNAPPGHLRNCWIASPRSRRTNGPLSWSAKPTAVQPGRRRHC
jgi:hypothetical protein